MTTSSGGAGMWFSPRRSMLVRVFGGIVVALSASTAAVLCVNYAGLTSNVDRAVVESIIVATFHDDDPIEGSGVAAVRVETSVPDIVLSDPSPMTLSISAKASGSAVDAGEVAPSLLIGGRLVQFLDGCDNSGMSTAKTFEDLDSAGQDAALAAVEEQMARVQGFSVRPDVEISSRTVRDVAAGMTFVEVALDYFDDSEWQQGIPDAARSVTSESGESPRPATQTFTGHEWRQRCSVSADIVRSEMWGVRVDVPSVGIALPEAWGMGYEPTAEGIATGIPVEAQSTLAWLRAPNLIRVSVAEEETFESGVSENQRAESLSAKGLVNADSPQYLMGQDQVGLVQSEVADDVYYLSAGRFSLQYSTAFYFATKDFALVVSGALFGLTATVLIALAKTVVRAYLRSPKP